MTGPRKRTLRRVSLVLSALAAAGTVNSSLAAAPTSGANGKNHSTSVKKENTQAGHNQAGNSNSSAAATPRAGGEQTARSSSLLAQSGVAPLSEEAAVRDALARRRAWTSLRHLVSESAKVQDPPAKSKPDRIAAEAPAGARLVTAGPADNTDNEDLIREALRNRGIPYVWGGASRGGFDCSGFVLYVFKKKRGISLPHSASAQARLGLPVGREELQPGDLVFFATYRPSISHVGIYIGNNQFVHAANHRSDVKLSTLTGYYANRYRGARRISPAPIRFTPEDLRQMKAEPSETPPAE